MLWEIVKRRALIETLVIRNALVNCEDARRVNGNFSCRIRLEREVECLATIVRYQAFYSRKYTNTKSQMTNGH